MISNYNARKKMRSIHRHWAVKGGNQFLVRLRLKKLLYFEWSPPWHVGWRLSGEGCRHTILFCHFVQIISCGPFSWRAPGKQPRSKVIATATAHVQTCQNMSGYDLTNISKKQKSNMSVDLLKQDQKLLQQQRCMLKHAKTCQDTTCQTYQRNRNQTCQ